MISALPAWFAQQSLFALAAQRLTAKLSLPVRECGLKHSNQGIVVLAGESLPVRECGLKLERCDDGRLDAGVTPRAGVWIETQYISRPSRSLASLPVRECGLKRNRDASVAARRARHSPCGSVD